MYICYHGVIAVMHPSVCGRSQVDMYEVRTFNRLKREAELPFCSDVGISSCDQT